MLEAVGLVVEGYPADLDEEAVKRLGGAPEALATTLAEQKALSIAQAYPGILAIGGDQILVCEGELFDKPGSADRVEAHLRQLSGSEHHLISGGALVRDDQILWSGTSTARLWMRKLSDKFIRQYAEHFGETVKASVGAYHFEAVGAQLFDRVEGDSYTILGFPLLGLLGALRKNGVLIS